MFNQFFSRRPRLADQDGWETTLVWLPVGHSDNPFQQEVLDCRAAIRSFTALAAREPVASGVMRIREAVRQGPLDRAPSGAMVIDCDFLIPCNEKPADGQMLVAPAIDVTWELYTRDDQIYFRRSRTGQLIHVAAFEFLSGEVRIRQVRSDRIAASNNASYALAEMKFLLDSCVARQLAAFPIMPRIPQIDVKTIAVVAWQTHGRWAQYGRRLNGDGSTTAGGNPGV